MSDELELDDETLSKTLAADDELELDAEADDDGDDARLETYESLADAPVDDVTEADDDGDAGPQGIPK